LLSQIPINLEKIKKEDLNKEILRAAIIAELDAVNLYEKMATLTEDNHIKMILLDVG
jgi:rubrerythrin